MPKMVVVILEDDLIKYVGSGNYVDIYYAKYIEEIIKDFHRLKDKMSNLLPSNSKRTGWPRLVFIQPTLHRYYSNYELRQKLIATIEETIKPFNDVWALKLLQIWDKNNCNYYRYEQQSHTGEGLQALWMAIDRTIHFANQKVIREELKTLKNPMSQFKLNDSGWHSLQGRGSSTERSSTSQDRREQDRIGNRYFLPKLSTYY